jgi:hypothetical protein
MNEGRFQLGLSIALLLGTAWYAFQMASYPANAGRVPLIVALVAAVALLAQIAVQVRALRTPARVPEPAAVAATTDGTGDGESTLATAEATLATAEARAHEVEEATEGYDVLLALDAVRRNRFIAIAVFSILFYVGAVMVGFVLATGILIPAFLLFARERVVTALVAGVLSMASVYGLVVLVLGLPALDGYLF